MIKIDSFKRGECRGKNIGIISYHMALPHCADERFPCPKWKEVENLTNFLHDYVGYENIYLLNCYTSEKYHEKVVKKNYHVVNVLHYEEVSSMIDDVVVLPDHHSFFGGVIRPGFFYDIFIVNDIFRRGGRYFIYDHDPFFRSFDPIITMNKYYRRCWIASDFVRPEELKRYDDIKDYVSEKIHSDSIILYDGIDYDDSMPRDGEYSKELRWMFFPINEYCFARGFDFKKILSENDFDKKKYKFGYYGSMRRSGPRRQILKNYLTNINSSVLIFKVWRELLRNDHDPRFDILKDGLLIPDLYYYLNENVKSTLFISDPENWNKYKSFRFFETLLLDIVGFIYFENDINKNFISDQFLKDYIYVSSPEDFIKKVDEVSNDKALYDRLVYLQRREFYEQCKDFFTPTDREIFIDYLKKNEEKNK